jgi:hypothetical protein
MTLYGGSGDLGTIFSFPVPVPEPSSLLLLAGGVVVVIGGRRARRGHLERA